MAWQKKNYKKESLCLESLSLRSRLVQSRAEANESKAVKNIETSARSVPFLYSSMTVGRFISL